MKKIIATIVCLTSIVVLTCAQHAWLSDQVLPGSYSRHFQNIFTAMENQAGLACMQKFTVAVSSDRRYLIPGLNLHTLNFTAPVKTGTFDGSIQQGGYRSFRQQAIGVGYGRWLGNRCSIGIQADYLSQSVPGYAHTSTITFEAGILLHLTQQISAGIHAFNPAGRRLGAERVTSIYSAGIGYEASTDCLLAVAVTQDETGVPATKLMGEYHFPADLLLQIGLCTNPAFSNLAIGIAISKLRIYCNASWHPQLGFTPSLALEWRKS